MAMENLYRKRYFRKENVEEISYHGTDVYRARIPYNFYELAAYSETTAWGDWKTEVNTRANSQYIALHLITENRCVFQRGKNKKVLEKNALVLSAPESCLSCYQGEKFKKRSLSIYFDFTSHFYGLDPDKIVLYKGGDISYIENLFDSVKNTILHASEHQACELSTRIYHLIYLLMESVFLKEPMQKDYMMKKIRYAPHCYTSIRILVEEFGFSERALTKIFREKYDTTPMDFVIRMRYEKAIWYLSSETPPVYVVAELCGFRNVPFFTRGFKKRYGMTPLEFRKMRLKEKNYLTESI